ncbi:serine/threonine-protein kinase [Hyalangium minutum]|uniref:Serine/threonine protein kinase n=1 Tax=Hyalangium minutum TaxID=394096 RepID=A0A085W3N1_9BACT|nr:serine/threonine-protein kinase [Hyalangium minutum]KFE62294.1 serine/threonine protein kinase [Hyalangium minutum]
MSTAPDARLGRILGGRYHLLSVLGHGGTGTVYEAEQTGLSRRVALKVLHAHVASSPGAVARFQREAMLMARLQHPGAAHVYDFGEEGGELFLAMERLHGETLDAATFREGPLPIPVAVDVVTQVLEVLEAAHTLGVVHRDLKPSNIMLTGELSSPRVKVLDFGLAQLMEGWLQPRITAAGMVHGTPAYMSPEQCRGETLDGRSDLYSLGCVLHELIIGQPPFPEESPAETMSGHLYRPAPPMRQLRPRLEISPALEALVLACLAKVKEQRPENAQVLRLRLRQTLTESSPSPQAPRGEGKKKERPLPSTAPAGLEVPSELPVGVLEAGKASPSLAASTALAAVGFQVVPLSEGAPLGDIRALVIVPAPGSDGLELARKLAGTPQAPPVLLCGEDDLTVMTRAIEGGIYDYVPLPLDPLELCRKVARALRARR